MSRGKTATHFSGSCTSALLQMTCRIRLPVAPTGFCLHCRRSGRRQRMRAATRASVARARPWRSDASKNSNPATSDEGSATAASAEPPAPVRHRALFPQQGRHRFRSQVARCLTLEVRTALRCHVLGHSSRCQVHLARDVPDLLANSTSGGGMVSRLFMKFS